MRCEQIRRHRQRRHRNCRPVLTWLASRCPSVPLSLSLPRSLFELCLCPSLVRMINNKSNAKMSVMYVACQRLRLFMAWINKSNAPIRDYKLTQRQKQNTKKKQLQKMSTLENVFQLLLFLVVYLFHFISN